MPNILTLQDARSLVTHNEILLEERTSDPVWQPMGSDTGAIINAVQRDTSVTASRQLAISSPLYNRVLSATLDMVVPPDTRLIVKYKDDKEKQSWKPTIEWFWEDGPSALSIHARNLVRTLFVDGEILIRQRINSGDGRVTLTDEVPDKLASLTRGEGFRLIKQVTLAKDAITGDEETFQVIRRDVATNKLLSGNDAIFYFRLFPAGWTAGGDRGLPLFVYQLDEVSSASELVYGRLSKLRHLAAFYWDVTMTGATDPQIDKFLRSQKAQPPEAGQVFVHNEQITWTIVSPKVTDISREIITFINLLAGTAGLTPEFLGHAPGRDITTESLFAAIAHLSALREEVFKLLHMLVRYQMEQAVAKNGSLSTVPEYQLVAKEIGTRSLQRAAQSFIRYADGLAKAVGEGLLTKEEAASVIRLLLVQLGLLAGTAEETMEISSDFASKGKKKELPEPEKDVKEASLRATIL